ncbi:MULTISPECIES: SPOR domain-containing protein [unclassified Streptomyces]|uniref:SPOR domain-containing protein n=1 Tax=unclassified Streptomyces TaxID=2593676 RepID=UPI002E2D91E1|nr:SPOR domain-containing protein [Streptomyces sp. NBC_00223]
MTSELVWVLIRQDDGGNRYRVGRYATRAEAERVADALGVAGPRVPQQRLYVIERVAPRPTQG